jgi:phosphomevalonate kinase
VHNLAQLSHCAAQGKIGSGFDVAAAVYGTMQYVRFSPQILDLSGKDTVGTADMAAVAHLVMATARGDSPGGVFDQEIGAWSLPSDMLLYIMLI